MDNEEFSRLVDEVVQEEVEAIQEVMKEYIEPLANVGSPEKLLGKRYDYWTPEDLQRLIMIYGEGDDTPLSKLIFDREYEKVKEMEEENG